MKDELLEECNELPDDIRSATSLLSFWKKLKAYLFIKTYLQTNSLLSHVSSIN